MIYITAYILLAAISMVFIHQLGNDIPEMLMVFLTTAYALVFFHVASFGKVRSAYKTALQKKGLFVCLQISVALMWFATFFVSIHYEPAFAMFTSMAYGSLIGLVIASVRVRDTMKLLQAFGILLVLVVFYVSFWIEHSVSEFLILFLSTTIGGVSMYWYLHLSCQMGSFHLKPTQILAIRFWLLLLASFIVLLFHQDYRAITGSVLLNTLLLAVFSLIAPIFCSQKAVERIGGNTTAILMGLTPFATFVLQKLLTSVQDNFIGYLSIGLALFIAMPKIHAELIRRFS